MRSSSHAGQPGRARGAEGRAEAGGRSSVLQLLALLHLCQALQSPKQPPARTRGIPCLASGCAQLSAALPSGGFRASRACGRGRPPPTSFAASFGGIYRFRHPRFGRQTTVTTRFLQLKSVVLSLLSDSHCAIEGGNDAGCAPRPGLAGAEQTPARAACMRSAPSAFQSRQVASGVHARCRAPLHRSSLLHLSAGGRLHTKRSSPQPQLRTSDVLILSPHCFLGSRSHQASLQGWASRTSPVQHAGSQ
jgi:hypothetical protein